MAPKKENPRRGKLTDAEIAHIALERRHGKKKRLSREWAITPEDLEGMTEAEKAEWIALAGNAKVDTNKGLTKHTSGTMEDAAEGRKRPDSELPSVKVPRGTGRLRRL